MKKLLSLLSLSLLTVLLVGCQKETDDPALEYRTFVANSLDNGGYCTGTDYYELAFLPRGDVRYKHFANGKTDTLIGYPHQKSNLRYRWGNDHILYIEIKDGIKWAVFARGTYRSRTYMYLQFREPYTAGEELYFTEK